MSRDPLIFGPRGDELISSLLGPSMTSSSSSSASNNGEVIHTFQRSELFSEPVLDISRFHPGLDLWNLLRRPATYFRSVALGQMHAWFVFRVLFLYVLASAVSFRITQIEQNRAFLDRILNRELAEDLMWWGIDPHVVWSFQKVGAMFFVLASEMQALLGPVWSLSSVVAQAGFAYAILRLFLRIEIRFLSLVMGMLLVHAYGVLMIIPGLGALLAGVYSLVASLFFVRWMYRTSRSLSVFVSTGFYLVMALLSLIGISGGLWGLILFVGQKF